MVKKYFKSIRSNPVELENINVKITEMFTADPLITTSDEIKIADTTPFENEWNLEDNRNCNIMI